MAKYPTRIVVIGAGYAGLLATVRLAGKTRRDDVTITLVNATDTFIERLRLHQFAANQTIKQRPISKILHGTSVEFIQGFVTGIEVAQSEIVVQVGEATGRIGYDKLLYALGSTIDRDSVLGVREHAYTLTPSGPLSAAALREGLPKLNATGGSALICGGGATGVEAAAEFAQSYPNLQVRLVTRGEFGAFLDREVAAYMRQSLSRRGVEIQDGATIAEVRAGEVLTEAGVMIPCDVCLWTGGFSVPSLARVAGLAVNERGQILIDPFMRSISHPEIYAVGDAAYPTEEPGVKVRMAAFTAAIMGAHGADCLSAAIQGQTPKPFSFAYMGQGIALGRHDAIGFGNYPDDKPHAPYFTGRFGYEFREFFVRFLADAPKLERRWPGFFWWRGKGRYAATKSRVTQPPVQIDKLQKGPVMNSAAIQQFETYRPLMYSIAYRMLGSAMEAEDIVQEAYLRYQIAQSHRIESPKAFLGTVVTRLCLNHLQSARVQRETYIGPWLPEPVLTEDDATASPAYKAELHESISLAFLTLLENLTPVERAVFLLREVFDYEYAEIAQILDKEESACRQLFSRAKKHIAVHRPRFKPTREEHRHMLDRFMQAVGAGELDGLMQLLADDVTMWADGGGKAKGAATHPLHGREAVAKFVLASTRLLPERYSVEVADVNGEPAVILCTGGRAVLVLSVEVDQGRVCEIRAIGNPDKLTHV